MKDIFHFICIFAYIAAVLGGFLTSLFIHEYGLTAGIVALGAMAYPYARKCYDNLTGKKHE